MVSFLVTSVSGINRVICFSFYLPFCPLKAICPKISQVVATLKTHKRRKHKTNRTWKVPEVLDLSRVSSLVRDLYLSVFLTFTFFSLNSLPRSLLRFVWCRGYCFKRQLLFLLSGEPSSFTSPEMKARSRLWECSLKPPLKKRLLYHQSTVWETTFPMLLFDQSCGVLLF